LVVCLNDDNDTLARLGIHSIVAHGNIYEFSKEFKVILFIYLFNEINVIKGSLGTMEVQNVKALANISDEYQNILSVEAEKENPMILFAFNLYSPLEEGYPGIDTKTRIQLFHRSRLFS
jgi:hypothetical protein